LGSETTVNFIPLQNFQSANKIQRQTNRPTNRPKDTQTSHHGTLFRSSCAIQTSPTDCSDDSWRDIFSGTHEHGALWLL